MNHVVMVHCWAGKSRSPSFVIAFLIKYSNYSLEKAHELVYNQRPSIHCGPSFMVALKEFEKQILLNQEKSMEMKSKQDTEPNTNSTHCCILL